MPIAPSKPALVFAWLLPAILLVALEAGATPPATPSLDESPQVLMLGRKNPFRPLVLSPGQHQLPAPSLPSVPSTLKPPKIGRPALRIAYLGLAYDGAESLAAVKVSGKVRFVRRGEEVAGATLTVITPEKLVWKRGKRRLESPLYRRPGAPTP